MIKTEIAVRALIKIDNHLVLCTQDKKSWWTPGGRVEKKESLDEALYRECREELGAGVRPMECRFIAEFQHDGTRKIELYFTAELMEDLPETWKDPTDFSHSFRLIPIRELKSFSVFPLWLPKCLGMKGNWLGDIYQGLES